MAMIPQPLRSEIPASDTVGPRNGRKATPVALCKAFTAAWERGESPVIEDYLRRLDPADFQGAVELNYREFCLAEADGSAPDGDAYIARFPRYAEPLRGLFRIHDACSPSLLNRLLGPPSGSATASVSADDPGSGLPRAGDSIGPYVLVRELGRGSFARVFLAEQAGLANRLVVIKVATRSTREPWLLAEARHAHIVEILSHSLVDDGDVPVDLHAVLGRRDPRRRPGRAGAGLRPARIGATPGDSGAHRPAPAPGPRPGPDDRRRPAGGPRRRRGTGVSLGAPGASGAEILAPLSYDRAIAWVIGRLAEALDHAASRDVTHGDVKPSNILLSADGRPMLLDFNLARNIKKDGDVVGTPEYMTPEQLWAAVSACTDLAEHTTELGSTSADVGKSARSRAFDVDGGTLNADSDDQSAGRSPHVSDVYSLGIVLLEALSGRPGSVTPMPVERAAQSTSTVLFVYAMARERRRGA